MARNPLARASFEFLSGKGYSICNCIVLRSSGKCVGDWYVNTPRLEGFFTDDELVKLAKELGFKPEPTLDPNHAEHRAGQPVAKPGESVAKTGDPSTNEE